MTDTEIESYVERLAAELGEHFEAVQIMVSWTENGKTKCKLRGSGNWYARQGMAHQLIQDDIANDTASCLAEKLHPPPDDSESWKQNPS